MSNTNRLVRPRAMFAHMLVLLGTALVLLAAGATPSHAQEPPPLEIPPTMRAVDELGVDRAAGDFIVPAPSIAIGTEGSGLDRSLSASGLRQWGTFRENHDGRITILWDYPTPGEETDPYPTGTAISYEGHTERFDVILTEYINAYYNSCTTSCSFPMGSRGSSLTCNSTSCTLTEKDGTVVEFMVPEAAQWEPNVTSSVDFGRISRITKPDGEIIDFSYYLRQVDTLHAWRWLKAVRSSLGWMIKYENGAAPVDANIGYRAWAVNLATDYCDIAAATCTFTKSWPTADVAGVSTIPRVLRLRKNDVDQLTMGGIPGGMGTRITSATGRITDITFWDQSVAKNCVFHPIPDYIVNCGPWYKNGRVAGIKIAGATWSYDYRDPHAPGGGGIPSTVYRTDPLGGHTEADVGGEELSPSVGAWQNELGRRTVLGSDEQGFITRVTYPEGNYVSVTYNARHNIVERREVAKPGSGLPDKVQTAFYDLACTNLKACGKALWLRDANANTPANIANTTLRTDYVYDPNHGGVTSVTGPADKNGLRKQTRFYYTQLYPKVKNASGTLVNSTPVWRVTRKETCLSSTNSCAGTADEQVELFEYNQNNLLQTARTVKIGDGSAQSRTDYVYDDVGNVISADGPRQDVDDKTYVVWDAFRRPVFDIGADPDGAGSIKRPIVKYTYDAEGRETLRQAGTGSLIVFTSGVPTDVSDFTVTTAKASTYDVATGRLIREVVSAP